MFGHAQDSVLRISAIDVLNWKLHQREELLSKNITRINPLMSYAQLLQKQNGLYIRSQGVGLLSTPSYKGLSTAHIPVLINGYSIQSSMNNSFDLSLVPAFHFSSVAFIDHNQDISPNNLGPQLKLNSSKQTSRAAIQLNSLQNFSFGFAYVGQKKNLSHSTSIFTNAGRQTYSLKPYGQSAYQTHDSFAHFSLMHQLKVAISNKFTYQLMLYGHYANRMIPPSLTAKSDGFQEDGLITLGNKINWQINKRLFGQLNHQLLREYINFSSIHYDLDENSICYTSNSSALLRYSINSVWNTHFGLLSSVYNYKSDALANSVHAHNLRLSGKVQYQKPGIQIDANQFVQWYNGKLYYAADLNTHYLLKSNKVLAIDLRKVIRIPSLNELYWNEPGSAMGDQTLMPEKGYRVDIYLKSPFKSFYITLNPYLGIYSQLIVWFGSPIIQASNVQNILSRGLELKWSKSIETAKLGKITLSQNTNWNKATYNDKSSSFSPYGSQLIYTPELTANLQLNINLKRFGFYFNQSYTSLNYYTSDNSKYITAYTLSDFGFYMEKANFIWSIQLNNIFNQAYFSYLNRPNPGFNGQLSLQLKLNNKQK